jgi:hypothetical protein
MIKNYKYKSICELSDIRRTAISIGVVSALSMSNVFASEPAVWLTPLGNGEMLFYDWGYSGPQGQTASQWESNGTFDGAAQIQHVVTQDADRLTPDNITLISDNFGTDQYKIKTDLNSFPQYYDPNMDTQTNFYEWGYTTTGGSTFNNMQIDADGDYLIQRNDMTFNYYNTFDYQDEGITPTADRLIPATEGIYSTNIEFQPYALSDATGWCGSITASNPGALEAMAGQVTFDFGFEAFLPSQPHDENGIGVPGAGGMQIVQDFEMRSYGSLEVNTDFSANGGPVLNFSADAVVNNTNPLASTGELDAGGNPVMITVPVLNMDGTQALNSDGSLRFMEVEKKTVGGGGVDENYYNTVSFMGGGVVPDGVWVRLADASAPITDDNILEVLDADDGGANTVWHENSFSGYPFLLRADGIRILDAMDFSLYSDLSGVPLSGFDGDGNLINLEGAIVQDLSAVPVPAAIWLFGSGLLGLIGIARKRKT